MVSDDLLAISSYHRITSPLPAPSRGLTKPNSFNLCYQPPINSHNTVNLRDPTHKDQNHHHHDIQRPTNPPQHRPPSAIPRLPRPGRVPRRSLFTALHQPTQTHNPPPNIPHLNPVIPNPPLRRNPSQCPPHQPTTPTHASLTHIPHSLDPPGSRA
jgi:hypothetical protein